MDDRPLTLKLTMTGLGPAGRYRSRIDQSPLGASSGPGCDFDLPDEQIKEWVRPLAKGAASRQDLVGLGQGLFGLALKDQVLHRYGQCVAVARERGARLRIALSLVPPRLIGVPWEYMHDGQSFLLKQGQSVVRVLDELPEKPAYAGPVERLLVAVANPKDEKLRPFDAEGHLRKLTAALGDLRRLDVLRAADAGAIRSALLRGGYEAFYFVGHGRFTEELEGQLVMEGADGGSGGYLDGAELAQWAREGEVRFAYLNACSGGQTGLGNPFAGVAQRLLRDGGVNGVVAMQAPVPQRAALRIAEEFFTDLQAGHDAEAALSRSLSAADDFSTWGLPVLYTYIPHSAVEEEAVNSRGRPSGAESSCLEKLSRLSNAELRQLLNDRMSRTDLGTVWYDTLGGVMDDHLPGRGVPECVIGLITRARQRGRFADLCRNLIRERPDLCEGLP